MKYTCWICVALLVGVSLPVFAEVGDLKPVAVKPQQNMLSMPVRIYKPESYTKPKEGDGTVSKKARIVTLPFEGRNFYAAIDSKIPDAKEPDVIRYDFTGQAKFDDEHVLPLTGRGGWKRFGPSTLMVPVSETVSIPVQVQGQYYHQGTNRYLQLFLGTALQGKCAFGEKAYPVQLVDCTSNMKCTDPVNVINSSRPMGDMVFIGEEVNLPDQAREGKGIFWGQPVFVDGKWYELKVSEDLKIAAAPIDVETAKAQIPHENWSIVLSGKKHTLMLDGGKEPFDIPVDRYTVFLYKQKGAEQTSRAQLLCYRSQTPIDIKSGEVNVIKAGPPLVAKMNAVLQPRQVRLTLSLTDAGGMHVASLSNDKSGRPEAPAFEIFDDTGKKVHGAKMSYG